MQTRELGKSGLKVSAIGLGCMGISFSYATKLTKEKGVALIRAAVDKGVTYFDTAEVYGPFENEEVVGEALRPFRDASSSIQVRLRYRSGNKAEPRCPAGGKDPEGGRGLAQAARNRNHRLALRAPRRSERADRGRRGNGQAIDRRGQGAAFRHVGAGRQDARRAHAVQPVAALQNEYRCGRADPRPMAFCRRATSSASASCPSPLGKGFLAGAMNKDTKLGEGDFRSTVPRFAPEAMEKNQPLIDLLMRVAGKRAAPGPSRARLAARAAADIAPIPGTTKLARLEEKSARPTSALTSDDLAAIESAASRITIAGERYAPTHLAMAGRDAPPPVGGADLAARGRGGSGIGPAGSRQPPRPGEGRASGTCFYDYNTNAIPRRQPR